MRYHLKWMILMLGSIIPMYIEKTTFLIYGNSGEFVGEGLLFNANWAIVQYIMTRTSNIQWDVMIFFLARLIPSLFVRRLSSVIRRWSSVVRRPSSVVRRPSVNISDFNLLLRNHCVNCNQILVEWSLDGPLPQLCPVIPTSNQDGRQAKNRKRGDEILILHCCFSISQNELKF